MARLDFNSRERVSEVLEIALPGGGELKLVPRRMPLSEESKIRVKTDKLLEQLREGEIDSQEYYYQLLLLRAEDFEKSLLDNLESGDISEILNELARIQSRPKRTDEEKKTQ